MSGRGRKKERRLNKIEREIEAGRIPRRLTVRLSQRPSLVSSHRKGGGFVSSSYPTLKRGLSRGGGGPDGTKAPQGTQQRYHLRGTESYRIFESFERVVPDFFQSHAHARRTSKCLAAFYCLSNDVLAEIRTEVPSPIEPIRKIGVLVELYATAF